MTNLVPGTKFVINIKIVKESYLTVLIKNYFHSS